MLALWKESYDKPYSVLRSIDITTDKRPGEQKLEFFQWPCTDVRVGP